MFSLVVVVVANFNLFGWKHVYLSGCLSVVCWCVCLSVCLFLCLSVFLFIHLSVCEPFCASCVLESTV